MIKEQIQQYTELTHILEKYIYQETKQNKRFLFIKACPKLEGYCSLDIINPPIIQNKQLAFNNCHINYLYTLNPTNLYSISFVNHPTLTYIEIKFNISSTIQYITTDNLTAKYLLKNLINKLNNNHDNEKQ